MVKISCEQFESIIKHIKDWNDMSDVLYKYGIDISNCATGWCIDDLCTVLKILMNDCDDWITWWCWETDFGCKKDMTLVQRNDDDKVVYVDTVEKLYDLIMNEEELWQKA